jgi:hypothetical protein
MGVLTLVVAAAPSLFLLTFFYLKIATSPSRSGTS